MDDPVVHRGKVLANVVDSFSGVPGSLSRDEHGHIDDGNAWRILVGLPDLVWPAPAEEFRELLSQTRAIHRLEEAWAEKNRSNLITFNRLG